LHRIIHKNQQYFSTFTHYFLIAFDSLKLARVPSRAIDPARSASASAIKRTRDKLKEH
jgi:hypothetical protein